MIKLGIVGGTGYTGAELLRLLARHPQARVEIITSRKEVGMPVTALFPQLRGSLELEFSEPDVERLGACDAVFFATPHGTAMNLAPALLDRGVRVIDLSADFRLRDAASFAQWYAMPHTQPEWQARAVYGLPEVNRAELRGAQLVACPGCYPTAVQLGYLPLLRAGVIDPQGLIADCKSGVSGAGREARVASLFSEVSESFKAYGVPGHRHWPEIQQGLADIAGQPVGVCFVPHLVPMSRGIHATLYARLRDPGVDLQALFATAYAEEPFVDVLPPGQLPETRWVRGSNLCRIAVTRSADGATAIVLSVIDNLVKGAAGQAVQCLNLMFGFDERSALALTPLAP